MSNCLYSFPKYIGDVAETDAIASMLTTQHMEFFNQLKNIVSSQAKKDNTLSVGRTVNGNEAIIINPKRYVEATKIVANLNQKEGNYFKIGRIVTVYKGREIISDVIGIDVLPTQQNLAIADKKQKDDQILSRVYEQEAKKLLMDDAQRAQLESEEEIRDVYMSKSLMDPDNYAISRFNEDVENKVRTFLTKLGIKVEKVNDLFDRFGAVAVADITNRLVQYQAEAEDAIPEEAAHFFVALLPKDHPLYVEAMNEIQNHPELIQKVYAEYANDYHYQDKDGNPNDQKLLEEAVGQLVGQYIYEVNEDAPIQPKNLSFIQRLIQWFMSFFKAKQETDSAFSLITNQILNGDISNLSFENYILEGEGMGLFFSGLNDFNIVSREIEVIKDKARILATLKNTASKISDYKKGNIKTTNKEVAATLGSLQKRIEELKLDEEESKIYVDEIVKSFVNLVSQTKALYKEYHRRMRQNILNIDNNDIKIIELDKLQNDIILLDRILEDIQDIAVELDPSNPIKKYVGEIMSYRDDISILRNRAALDALVGYFGEQVYAKDYYNLKKEYEAKVQALEEKKKLPNAPIDVINKNIEALWEKFDKLAPSELRLRKGLMGELGDSSLFGAFFQKAIASNDYFIAGLQKKYEELLHEQNKALINTVNRVSSAQKELVDKTGANLNTDKSTFGEFVTVVKRVLGIDEEGNEITTEKLHILNEHDPEYIIKIDKIKAELNNINRKIAENTDPNKYIELIKERREILARRRELFKDFELEYTEEYYKKTEDIQDEVMTYENKDTGETEEFTLREVTRDVYDRLSMAYHDLELAENLDRATAAADVIRDIQGELDELKRLYDKIPGTKEYMIAMALRKSDTNKKEVFSYKRTKESDERFEAIKNLQKSRLDAGLITQEVYDLWARYNIRKSPKQEYFDELKEIIEELDVLRSFYLETDEEAKNLLSDLQSELKERTRSKLDDDGYINGNEFSEEEVAKIKEIEEKIIEVRSRMVKMTGLTQEELTERREIKEKLKLAMYSTSEERDEAKKRLKELNKLAKDSKYRMDEEDLERYQELSARLSEMSETLQTEHYEERYNREFNKFAAELEINLEDSIKNGVIKIGSNSYSKVGKKWVADKTLKLSEEEMIEAVRVQKAKKLFTKSDWFQKNHIAESRFVTNALYGVEPSETSKGSYETVYRPLYIWNYSEPTDKDMIDEEAPTVKYLERVVDDKYKNTVNYNKRLNGYPMPKPGKYVDARYKKLSESKDPRDIAKFKFLKEMSEVKLEGDRFIENINQRSGYELPSIEKDKIEAAAEAFEKDGVSSFGTFLKEEAKRKFTITEQDKDVTYEVPLSEDDVLLRNVPLMLRRDLEINLQSYDLPKLVLLNYETTSKRYSISKLKPTANVLLKTVSEADVQVDEETKNVIGKLSRLAKKTIKKGGQSNTYSQLKELMESLFLGKTRKPMIVKLPVVGKVDASKIIGAGMGLASRQFQSFKLIGPVKNAISGQYQMMLSSITNPDMLTTRNLAEANGYVTRHVPDIISDMFKAGNKSLIGQMADYFDFLQGSELRADFGEKIDYTKLRTLAELKGAGMMPQNWMEKINQYIQAVAIMKTIMVERNGEKIPMIEAYELKNGLIQPKDGVVVDEYSENRLRALIKEVNARSNGNLSKLDKAVIQKHAVGEALYHFNKYLIPGFQYRYGSERYNAQTGKIETGFYYQAFSAMYDELKQSGWNPVKAAKNLKWREEEDVRAMQALAVEFGSILLMISLLALLGNYDPDKKKKITHDDTAYGYFMAQFMNILKGTKTEVETFNPITGIDNVLQKASSPFLFIQTLKLMRRTAIDALSLDTYKKDTGIWEKGDAKFIADLVKLYGLQSLYVDAFEPGERFKSLERAENLRN